MEPKHIIMHVGCWAIAMVLTGQGFPDFHPDADQGKLRYAKDQGQVFDTEEDARPD